MAKSNTKKSFLDYFKLNDSADDFDDDLFDEEEDEEDDFDEYEQPPLASSKASSYQTQKASYNASATQPVQKKQKSVRQTKSAAPANNKLVSINSGRAQYSSQHVYVIKPDEFDDAQMIIDHLRSGQAIVINMEGIELSTAQRIIDFIAGACYAVDGSLQAISGNIFIAAPNDIYVSGDLREEILGDTTIATQFDRY